MVIFILIYFVLVWVVGRLHNNLALIMKYHRYIALCDLLSFI
jgi:hypothetical protein